MFAIGAGVLLLVVVTGEAGAYGLTAIIALLTCLGGVVMLGAATVVWSIDRLRRWSTSRRRTAAALAALGGAGALLSFLIADLVGEVDLVVESGLLMVAGITLLVLASVLAAERSERRPALVFAATWILLLGGLAYRTWTDLRVEVVWLGPNTVDGSPGQVAFTATRSGDFEVRFGAHTCWDGRIIATGQYMWQPGDRDSSYGAPMWIDLPPEILPLHSGHLIRVCVRDWLAAGTRAGEAVDPPSFWPRD